MKLARVPTLVPSELAVMVLPAAVKVTVSLPSCAEVALSPSTQLPLLASVSTAVIPSAVMVAVAPSFKFASPPSRVAPEVITPPLVTFTVIKSSSAAVTIAFVLPAPPITVSLTLIKSTSPLPVSVLSSIP